MKHARMQGLVMRSMAVIAAATASVLTAPGLIAEEFVVGAQVVSDQAVAGPVVESGAVGQCGCSQCVAARRGYGQPDLFYNYYTQGYANQTNAQMYVSPLPVPPNVGHTFTTYQPFYPHEYLYWHKDRFHNYYDGGRGMNRTRATYYSPPVRQAVSNVYWNMLRIPR